MCKNKWIELKLNSIQFYPGEVYQTEAGEWDVGPVTWEHALIATGFWMLSDSRINCNYKYPYMSRSVLMMVELQYEKAY